MKILINYMYCTLKEILAEGRMTDILSDFIVGTTVLISS
jgi:hypothetical protein